MDYTRLDYGSTTAMILILLLIAAVQSPKGMDLFGSQKAFVPKSAQLVWKYPFTEPSVVFNIWTTTNMWQTNICDTYNEDGQFMGRVTNRYEILHGWKIVSNTTNLYSTVYPTNSMALFFVTASNTITQLESPKPNI